MRIILCFQIIGREKDDVIIRVKWQVMPSLDGAGRGGGDQPARVRIGPRILFLPTPHIDRAAEFHYYLYKVLTI